MKKQLLYVFTALTMTIGLPVVSASRVVAATQFHIVYIAIDIGNATTDLFKIDLDSTNNTNLTNTPSLTKGLTSSGYIANYISPDNTRVLFTSSSDGGATNNLHLMNTDGSGLLPLTTDGGSGVYGSGWSPDSSSLVFTRTPGFGADIFSIEPDGSSEVQLTSTGLEACPVWSPDGTQIAFASLRDGNAEIYVMNADGSNETNLTNDSSSDGFISSFCSVAWAPDSSRLIFGSDRDNPGSGFELYTMDRDGSDLTRMTTTGSVNSNFFAKYSPDGTQIAFISDQHTGTPSSDEFELYVMNADGSNQVRVTNDTGPEALVSSSGIAGFGWAPDSSVIAYSADPNNDDQWHIFTVNPDGTNRTQITTGSILHLSPAWIGLVDSVTGGSGPSPGGSGNQPTLSATGDPAALIGMSALLLLGSSLFILYRAKWSTYKS